MAFAISHLGEIMQTTSSSEFVTNSKAEQSSLAIDISGIANPTLARLLAEVKNDEGTTTMGAYDRAHNRHNR
jgi:hypothetical protein